MVTREYECDVHGYFTVNRQISEPTLERCPACDAIAFRVYTQAAQVNFKGAGGSRPDYNANPSEYRDWQKAGFAKLAQDTHPDNGGKRGVNPQNWKPPAP